MAGEECGGGDGVDGEAWDCGVVGEEAAGDGVGGEVGVFHSDGGCVCDFDESVLSCGEYSLQCGVQDSGGDDGAVDIWGVV